LVYLVPTHLGPLIVGGLVITALGHLPVAGESVELPAFEPDGHFDDPIMWLATVVAMDGRRIDVLELSELGPRSRRASDEPEAH
ncbi:MAG TPA: transporter associated domain-containing protein, partial [Mycobacterium sp.]|nr:transporter associated domain-containing protein [Mycobacterium sp.]